ncbi:unnamed protein product [Candidula unifasciata]|uniref:PH domain-containing protein n=1 Tax=Candidula unifasciata TaxID=100452 RepID=A0A8S3ZXX2_9EUPU|nr:unnamed protein product [Candidula unifasciata]
MKRRKASAKMTNVVHSGWMTKSPPERKLNSAFKIFRSQWKKRYFVLRKPSGSLPDQYELHYYKDQKCNTKKGSIDLEQCEQIIEALDSDVFPYLLAIKTYYKNKVRTYYLAADTEQEMNTWVQWLCHVCGLKPEDQPTDIPDPKPSQAAGVVRQTSVPATGLVVANGRPASPQRPASPGATATITSSPLSVSPQAAGGFQSASPQAVVRTLSDSSLCYIPLENCTTGQPVPVDRRESVESVPDFEAPAPPQKLHSQSNGTHNLEDEVFSLSLYDHPPAPRLSEASSRKDSSDLYKVPPVRPVRGRTLETDETGRDLSYDIPPPPRGHSPHSSLSAHNDSWASSGGGDRSPTPTECYDHPPPRRDPIVSSDGETPPARPPKPGHLQSPYQNLPPAGNISTEPNLMNTVLAPPKHHTVRQTPGYDVPRSSTHHLSRALQSGHSHIVVVPPRPSRYTPTNPSTHTYLNTQNKAGSNELHLVSGGGTPAEPNTDLTELGLVLLAVPPPPRTDSAGESSDANSASPSLYQSPPSSSALPVPSGAPARPPARTNPQPASISPRGLDGISLNVQDENTAIIFSTQRTRSFKRNQNTNNISPKPSPKLNPAAMSAPVPAPRPVLPSRPKEISSDEDEDATHHPLSLLRAVPPPTVDNDRELKYIDLALPDSSQEPPRSSHTHGHGHTHSHAHNHMDRSKESATEYREIDFIKTQALNDTKRVKEKERKNDDHN